jgi:hypothetical protein
MVKTKKKNLSFKGVAYRSSLERHQAVLLDAAGIDFEYEPLKLDIFNGFDFPFKSYERQSNGKGEMVNRGEKKILGITYTPDFVGDDFIIETKGYANETFPLRWKLFKKWLIDNGYDPNKMVIYKPQKISECQKVVELIKKHRSEQA